LTPPVPAVSLSEAVTQAEQAAVEAECPETWLRRRIAAALPAETWVPVPGWFYEQIGLPVPAVPHEGSNQGNIRNATGHVLALRPTGRPKELPAEEQYRRTNLCVGGKKVPVLVHHVILACFHPEARGEREARHLGQGTGNRAWNWYPEGVTWGTRQENAFDKPPEVRSAAARVARHAQADKDGILRPPRPTFQCRNWVRAGCGGMVAHEGSRCGACVVQVGKDAAVLLRLRMPAQAVGEFFGHTGPGWVLGLAREHGGYTGSAAEARMQHPTPWGRVLIWRAKRQMRGHAR
jgi:hypothetical protein